MAQVLDMEDAPPTTGQIVSSAARDVAEHQYNRTGDLIKASMTSLVKGAGYVNGNQPLGDQSDITARATKATLDLRTTTHMGYANKSQVVGGLNPKFLDDFGYLKTALTAPSQFDQMVDVLKGMPGGADAVNKSFTAGNLGIGSVYGLAPFDLRAPSRLIYPVYTVLRNKLPRPAGQGLSMQEKLFTGISGSGTGGQGVLDISTSELTGSTSFSNWPLNLPQAGSQTDVALNVPYRFFGLTEQLSFLAQFAGQGFEDVSALANLILLQEMMLGEEYMMLAGTSTPLATPATPTVTLRSAGSNETPIGSNANYAVAITAVNYYGETVISGFSSNVATTASTVVDVTIAPVAGALQYNIYVSVNASPTQANAYLAVGTTTQAGVVTSGTQSGTGPGGIRFTLQGAAPTSGNSVVSPTADTGTGKGTRMEGVIPTLTGQSANAGIYPQGWKGGYVNQAVGTHLSYNVIYTALDGLWETNGTNTGAFKADPAEIMGNGGDIMRLSNDVIAQGSATNYRLFLEQSEVPGVRVGAAVSEFQNPITRSVMKLVVHPWLTQGNAMLMTYQLPQVWSNLAQAWEMVCVQDYVSIAWPVIDATFRYSIFLYGAMTAHAPQYSGFLGGLQVSDTTPFS
jgi:hypothetical protein